MSEKESKTTPRKPISKKEPKSLPPRIHFNEFTMVHSELDDMQKAGFKAFCKKEWMRKEEWQQKLNEYLGKK